MKKGSLFLTLIVALASCGDRAPSEAVAERRGTPPPPAASAAGKPIVCSRTAVDDAESKGFFPAKTASFCLDPGDAGKAMGEGAPQPLERMCDLFDGECQVYEDHGVKRVFHTRYVSEDGSGAVVDVVLSRFVGPGGAYAMFTKRVVGDGDPADPATPKSTPAAGVAALGVGNAYLWRGSHLLEATFSDEQASPSEIERRSAAVLAPLVDAIAKALPGATDPPADIALLPVVDRVALGVRYVERDLIRAVKDSGSGAIGYYASGGKRWRVIAATRADAAGAEKLFDALSKIPAATQSDGNVSFSWKDGATSTEWIAAQKGTTVVALTDEPRVVRSGATQAERERHFLSLDEKRKRLDVLVQALP